MTEMTRRDQEKGGGSGEKVKKRIAEDRSER